MDYNHSLFEHCGQPVVVTALSDDFLNAINTFRNQYPNCLIINKAYGSMGTQYFLLLPEGDDYNTFEISYQVYVALTGGGPPLAVVSESVVLLDAYRKSLRAATG